MNRQTITMNKTKQIDKIINLLLPYQNQMMAAGMMLMLSAVPIASAYFYAPQIAVSTEGAAEAVLPESTWQAETIPAASETTADEKKYIPTPGELNLAYYFPKGADNSRITESLAGQAFKVLMTHDENWMSSIYDMADASPVQMAKALGKPRKNVLGKYNYKNELHDIENPDSWTIDSFKKVRMLFTNGDGQPVSAYSNVIDIMSMANLYTYFNGVEDYDLFLSYAQALWDRSHSYSVGISGVYYCDGCLDEDAERREYEELEAAARAEEEAGYPYTAEQEETKSETSENSIIEEDASAEKTSAVITAGAAKTEIPEESTAAALPETISETIPESTSGVIIAGQPSVPAESESESETEAYETFSEVGGESGQATPADAEQPGRKTAAKCPGHVDLIVNVKVIGIKEENSLFKQDIIGNDAANLEENGWPGWNRYTMASVKQLSSQDWFEKYGLSLSVISMMNPLTEAEIDSYMNQLPNGISETRKDLVYFALSSVGKVPYYWGGKPTAPDYASNSFGILTAPDYKGRVYKGLDCSGWISWVYWSVTGQRLPYESTSGLAISGAKISRSELQPGDIVVRTGSDAHVIMFLGWTADGRIRCIHESSAGVNNVTVAIREANWPYYRKLVE